jgi:hypothetical protein
MRQSDPARMFVDLERAVKRLARKLETLVEAEQEEVTVHAG